MRGAVSLGVAVADRTVALGAKTSPIKRASKDVERCEGCKDELGALGWSNEKRSPKGESADGGSDRLCGSWNANSETCPV